MKKHFYTPNTFSHKNNGYVWFESACKLSAKGSPSREVEGVTCMRCLNKLDRDVWKAKLRVVNRR